MNIIPLIVDHVTQCELVIGCRVFSDRLNDAKDTEAFVFLLSEKLAQYFDQTYHNICPNRQPPIFGKSDTRYKIQETLFNVGLYTETLAQ